MHLDNRRLGHFLAVAEHGSINRAADFCFISQAGLTKSIRTLEDQVGGELFERRPQGVRLTRLGETFLRHARLLDNQFGKAADALQAQIAGSEVELRIGVSMRWVLRRIVPEVLTEIANGPRNPRITVISAYQSWRMIEDLRNGDLDLVLATPSEVDDLSGVEAIYFEPDRQGVVARKDHPLAGRGAVDLRDILSYEWIRSAPETYSWRYLTSICMAHHLTPPQPRLTIDSSALTLDIVAQTELLAISSQKMLMMDHAESVVLLDTPIIRERTTTILTRAGDALPAVAKDVIAAIGARLGPQTEASV